jgi:hypothetical protein
VRKPVEKPPPVIPWLKVADIAARYQRNNKTVLDWIVTGVQGIKLHARKIGGLWMVDPAWLEEFFTALEAVSAGRGPSQPPGRVRKERRQSMTERARKAIERLKADGLM